MFVFKKVSDLTNYLDQARATGKEIGFVPTMGALHQGHIALIDAAAAGTDLVVCSIFVNPAQFNEPEDLKKYPRPIEQDLALLEAAGCAAVFLPSIEEVYPAGLPVIADLDIGYLDTVLEGSARPGHFQGVVAVVRRLLSIVQPGKLYLGQKDVQQCMVIKQLVAVEHIPVDLEVVPTRREADGLAMSSRNTRLTEPQRVIAGVIYQCLVSIQVKQHTLPFSVVQKECTELLEKKGFKVDYLLLADAGTLELLADFDAGREMVAVVAVYLGEVRLIDNLVL